ncbi:glycosyltransferase [Desulfosporosinus fructosivorans]
MRKKTIAMFNLTETRRDPRVRRIANTLADMGNRVIVFGMKSEVSESYEKLDGFEIVRIDIPLLYTEKEMSEIGKVCKEAGIILSSCDPNIISEKISLMKIAQLKVSNGINRLIKQRFMPQGSSTTKRVYNPEQEILAIRSIMLINLGLYQAALQYKPDIVHCNDLDTLLTGYMFKINFALPLIFDAHEIYPEQLEVNMRSEIWYNFYSRLEKKLIPFCDGRLTVCDSLGDYFKKTYDSGEFATIRNTVSLKYLPEESILLRKNKPVRILYHGAYFPYRGLDELIEAAPLVENAIFIFRGIGSYERVLREKANSSRLENKVYFVDPVGVNDLVQTACENDVGVNPFISVCKNTEYALPNKFFEYMMAGLAILSSDLVEMRRLTLDLSIGSLFSPDNPNNIAKVLNEFTCNPEKLNEARHRAYHAAKNEFNWEKEEEKLKKYYESFS